MVPFFVALTLEIYVKIVWAKTEELLLNLSCVALLYGNNSTATKTR